MKMKNLNSISTSSFANCLINIFDALNLKTITININEYTNENVKFIVGEKNFPDSLGIIQKVDYSNEEPDYEKLIQKLPKECF